MKSASEAKEPSEKPTAESKSESSKSEGVPAKKSNSETEKSNVFEESPKALVWKDLEVSVPVQRSGSWLQKFRSNKDGTNSKRRNVLHGISGVAEAGELLAIMGESGAGKTTLLNILTRRNTKGLKWVGEINVNGEIVSDEQMMRMSAYVQQVDMFCGNLTVKEHLKFSAHLRMHPRYSYEEREERVKKVIEDMGLVDCQNTKIAIRFSKSLSMGEMKRLSFASEVLTDPAILFCDEPTSGLDAFMARQVVVALRRLAKRGKTIVMTIHQPSSQVYDMFDKLCLMSLGKVAYLGPAREVVDLFGAAGYPLPPFTNPADHVIHTLATSEGREEKGIEINVKVRETFEASETAARLKERTHGTLSERSEKWNNEDLKTGSRYAAPYFRQLYYCTKRSFTSTLRDPLLLKVRFIQMFVTSLIIGLVNLQMHVTPKTVMNYNGILFNSIRDMQFMFMMPCVHRAACLPPRAPCQHLPRGCLLHWQEPRRTTQYVILPVIYAVIVNYIVDLHETVGQFFIFMLTCVLMTNLGTSVGYAGACIFGEIQTAVIYIPIMVIPMMVFGGFYIRLIPSYIDWLKYFSWFRYAYEAQMINRWGGENVNATVPGCEGNTDACTQGHDGNSIINKFLFKTTTDWMVYNIVIMIGFMLFFRVIAIIAMMARARFAR
ncbi:hypothetical protein L596_023841 [Steinernema carpocapsae]|uniref:ABC transporter domain-containing protein n=1 Tax=Steinernema carpocapsae TaxID=34508 RepID=A0A4U5MEX7_STECR|nr:hypothetical protein L596_023841 [Steinernema carpocapsae]